jgi:Cu-Zn family superoxide dismutase
MAHGRATRVIPALVLAGAVAVTPVFTSKTRAQSSGAGQTAQAMRDTAPPEHGTPGVRAHADIAGKGITGTADFVEYTMGTARWVQVTLRAKGLTPGLHGVHLHAIGKCEPDFAAAGGHFDPGPAGNTDPDANHPFHMGDLPNLEVGANQEGQFVAATTRVTLSDGPLSVFDADGTAIIIHGNPDQGITGEPKSGVSGGPRVGCGVLNKIG